LHFFLKTNYIAFFSADGHKLENTFEETDVSPFVIDRLEFDNLIRNVAVDAGAELFDKNISYDFVYKDQKRVGIKTKTSSGIKEYIAKLIIVADGMSSKLANKSD